MFNSSAMYVASFKATRLITVQWKLYSEHERKFISRRNNADKCDLFRAQARLDARNFYVTIKISWQVSMSVTGCTQARVIYRSATMDLSCVIYRAGTRRCGTVLSSTMAGTIDVAQKSFTVFSRNTHVSRACAEGNVETVFINFYLHFMERPLSRVWITISYVSYHLIRTAHTIHFSIIRFQSICYCA